jgi:dolichol-phosphate mannosyltransferase
MTENKTKDYDLTVVVPVYNEEDNLPRVEQVLAAYTAKASVKACVLLVNDGSCDASLQLIKDICRRQPQFFYISSARNHGLSTAIAAAASVIESRLTGYIDADLQTHPDDFELLLPHAQKFPLVTGIRAHRKDSWGKRQQSKIANAFRRKMTGDTATDTGCPLKVMWTDMLRRLPVFDGMHRFLPALFMLEGAPFKEVPVRHFPRTAGVSKYHLSNRLVKPFFDCMAFRWLRSRHVSYHIDSSSL